MMTDYIINDGSIIEPQREIPVLDSADVLIAGGGIAGIGAAIAAGREGVRTVLVEQLGFLGGVAAANLNQNLNSSQIIEDSILFELLDRMAKKGTATRWNTKERMAAMVNGNFNRSVTIDVESFKQTALEMCSGAGVVLYLYTSASMPIIVQKNIVGVIVESKAGRQAILSKRVVDCTGDGDLLYRAGVEFTYGRESDHKARPFVLMFRIGGLDVKKMMDYLKEHPSEWESKHRVDPLHKIGNEHVYTRVSGFTDLVAKAKQNGDLYDDIHSLRLEALMIERGIAQVNTTRIYYVDGTNPVDLTKGEIMGRWQMEKVVAFMRKYVPGGENTYVLDVAPMIGVRETRRFRGEYFLTNEDAHNDMSFEDNIMLVEIKLPPLSLLSIVDVHPVEPIEGSEKDLWTRDDPNAQLEKRSFHFNYRMLLPQGIDNMLYAGRTMPTTHAVEAFVREMPLCMRMGQVAGTAAAISVTHNVSPKKLEYSLLKNALLKQGYTRF